MASLEDLQTANQIGQTVVDTNKAARQDADRKVAAAQAAAYYKQGDIRSAYSVLMQKDPEFAAKIAPDLTRIDPDLAGQLKQNVTEGELTGQTKFGSNPAQLEDIRGKYAVQAAQAKANAAANSVSTVTNKASGDTVLKNKKGEIIGVMDANNQVRPINEAAKIAKSEDSTSTKTSAPKSALAPDQEQMPDGSVIRLNTNQIKGLNKDTESFNKDTKDLTKSINNAELGRELILKNIPGTKVVEQLRILKGAVESGRVAVQEVQALGGKEGVATQLETAMAEAAGKGMGPTTQQNMLRLADAVRSYGMDEYRQILHQRAAQTAEKQKVDPAIVIKRLAPEMPTPIQQRLQDIQNLPPLDQQAIDWAHQTLLKTKNDDPNYQKAIQILKMHGL
jgi:hypothetical protein